MAVKQIQRQQSLAKSVYAEHFKAWLCLTNTAQMSQNERSSGFGVIFLGKKSLTFMIPVHSTRRNLSRLSENKCRKNPRVSYFSI